MNEKKTVEHAASVIKAMQEEYAKGVIKDWEIPPMVNMKTGETTGFAVVINVASKYDYTEDLLKEWKERFDADEYKISARRNQLWITFTIRTFVPTEAHITKMAHAIGLDNKKPDKSQFYEAYRNGSWYDKPDDLWDELVLSGFAIDRRKPNDYGYRVSPKGMQFLAEHYKIMINYTNEYEGRTDV